MTRMATAPAVVQEVVPPSSPGPKGNDRGDNKAKFDNLKEERDALFRQLVSVELEREA